jgi:hypothetical protein
VLKEAVSLSLNFDWLIDLFEYSDTTHFTIGGRVCKFIKDIPNLEFCIDSVHSRARRLCR